MPQNNPTEIWPGLSCPLSEGFESTDDLLLECLVINVGDVTDTLGVVADQTAEEDDCPAIGSPHPLGRDLGIETVLGESDPGLDVGRRDRHGVMVVGGELPDAWHPTSVFGMAPPDVPEENENFGMHPHPDDRLWRHPSETASSGETPGSSIHRTSAPPTLRSGRSVLLPISLIAVVLGSAITLGALSIFGAFDPTPTRVVIERVDTDLGPAGSTETVVERVRPAIVRIEVRRGETTSFATGVIYRSDGYVITTADAVQAADSIIVVLADGRSVDARVVGIDAADDVAVLQIDGVTVTPIVLGDPETLASGETAIALSVDSDMSSPTAVVETIAGSGRRIDAIDGTTLHDMIQSRGNGASFDDAVLFAPNGALLGIFTTRTPEAGGASGAANGDPTTRFATPIDFAVQVADEIVATGSSQQPWLGVTSEDLDSVTIGRLGRAGTVLTNVAPGGPANASGLQSGDIIVSIDDAPVISATTLVVALRNREAGMAVSITYIRDGAQRTTIATLIDRP